MPTGTSLWSDGAGKVTTDVRVGIGTDSPKTALCIKGFIPAGMNPENHVVVIQNLNSGDNTNGLAIRLSHPNTTGRANNFVTFYNDGPQGLPKNPVTGEPLDLAIINDFIDPSMLPINPETGQLFNTIMELPIDEVTGLIMDPNTGLPIAFEALLDLDARYRGGPQGLPKNPLTGEPIDLSIVDNFINPSMMPINPETGQRFTSIMDIPKDEATDLIIDPNTNLPIDFDPLIDFVALINSIPKDEFSLNKYKIAGRIEGLSIDDYARLVEMLETVVNTVPSLLSAFKIDLGIDLHPDFFDPVVLPDFSLTGGRPPSIGFHPGTYSKVSLSPGTLPTASFNRGVLPEITDGNGFCDGGVPGGSSEGTEFCIAGFELNYYFGSRPSLNFSGGTLPKLNYTPGTLSTLTLDPGEFPTLNAAGGTPPSISAPFTFARIPSIAIDLDKLTDIGNELVNNRSTNPDNLGGNFSTFLRIIKSGGIKGTALDMLVLRAFGGGVTYESRAGDYAEWLERSNPEEELQFGDVVGVFNGMISKKTKGADQAMVVSFKPIVLGNMPPKEKEGLFEKVAFMGQVPVKVMGPVKKGDYIIPSGRENGFARAISPGNVSVINLPHVIGTSWGESDFNGVNLINVAVGLKPVEFAKVVKGQARKIVLLKNELETVANELKSENDQLKKELLAMKNRQTAVEDMLLALSTDLPKEKLVNFNRSMSVDVQKSVH